MRGLLGAVTAGFVATLVMTVVMVVARFYLGTPFIPELLAQKLFSAYYADWSGLSSITSDEYISFTVSTLVHLGTGTILGALFFYLFQRFNLRNPILYSIAYSITLWLVFSAVFLPLLGFGFFGKYFAGFPAIAVAALFIFFLVYGLVLSFFFVGMCRKG